LACAQSLPIRRPQLTTNVNFSVAPGGAAEGRRHFVFAALVGMVDTTFRNIISVMQRIQRQKNTTRPLIVKAVVAFVPSLNYDVVRGTTVSP
jgi:hypothetical protein